MSKVAAGQKTASAKTENDIWKGGVEALKRIPIHAMHPRCIGISFVPDSAESITEDGHWVPAHAMRMATMAVIPVGHFRGMSREVRLASVLRLEVGRVIRAVPDENMVWDFRGQPAPKVRIKGRDVVAGEGLAKDTLNSDRYPRLFRIFNQVQSAMTATGFRHSELWRKRVQRPNKPSPPIVCGSVSLDSAAGASADFDMPMLYVSMPESKDRRRLLREMFEVQCLTVPCRADFLAFAGHKQWISRADVNGVLMRDGNDFVRAVNKSYWDLIKQGEQSIRDRFFSWFESRVVSIETIEGSKTCIPYRLVADYAVQRGIEVTPVAWYISSRTQNYFDPSSESFILPPVKQYDWRNLRMDAQSIDVCLATDPRISLTEIVRPVPAEPVPVEPVPVKTVPVETVPEPRDEPVIEAANPHPVVCKPCNGERRIEALLGVDNEPEPKHFVLRRSHAVSKRRRLEIADALRKHEEKNTLAKSLGIG